ncbi:MAG: DMT family transporter [Candidatus Micrarchaeota archaeon]|nr:DMT family transporter [Candidatus Micrarchaeota archaeon]
MDTSTGIMLALFSMFAFGISDILTQKAVRGFGSLNTAVYRGTATIAVALAFFALSANPVTFDGGMIVFAAALGIFGFIPYMTFLKAMNRGKIGIVSPIANSSFVITAVLAVFLFGELFTALHALSVILILVGIALLTFDVDDIKDGRAEAVPGALLALLTSLMWGVYFLLFSIPARSLGPYPAVIITEVFLLLTSLSAILLRGDGLKRPDRENLKIAVLDGIFVGLGGIMFANALMFADVGLVTTISKASPLIAITLAAAINREKLKPYRYPAMLMVIIGIGILAVL